MPFPLTGPRPEHRGASWWTAVATRTATPSMSPAPALVPGGGPRAVPASTTVPAAAYGRCEPPAADAVAPATDAGRLLHLDAVHRIATGTDQTIAVIDTGVAAHQRLGARLRGAGDLVAGGDGRTDCDGHGTAVAGLLAAAPGSSDDMVGMAPEATVLSIRQNGTTPEGRPAGDVETLARAITLAVELGASVINLSEAACVSASSADRVAPELRDALRAAARNDVVVVAAAGNIGPGGCTGGEPVGEVALPGYFADDVLTVGAVGPDGAPADFTVPGSWVDVAAPGTGLRSLAVGGGLRGTRIDGTSFAAPWVSGLAALVRQRYPELTAAEVVDRILATARRPPGAGDAALGHGVIDPIAALTAVPIRLRPDGPPPAPPAVLAGTTPLDAPPAEHPPVELLAVVVLAVAAGSGVVALRRRPERG
jgi:membrane-anchored mycosin MYCP